MIHSSPSTKQIKRRNVSKKASMRQNTKTRKEAQPKPLVEDQDLSDDQNLETPLETPLMQSNILEATAGIANSQGSD